MKKTLVTLLSIGALGLGACKKTKNADDKATPAPTEKTAEPAKPDEKPAPPPAPIADLPQECKDYKDTIDKLMACDKMQQPAKDAAKAAFDKASSSWSTLTGD